MSDDKLRERAQQFANEFICAMDGTAPTLTSTDFRNVKKLTKMLTPLLAQVQRDTLEEAAKAVESWTSYLAIHGFHRFPHDDIRDLVRRQAGAEGESK